jgi:signal transduction histidine kinase/CheY-like chemotaxis protein
LQLVLPTLILKHFSNPWTSHFRALSILFERFKHTEIKILVQQEIPMYVFFLLIIYHYQKARYTLKASHETHKHRSALISTVVDNAPLVLWSWSKENIINFCRGRMKDILFEDGKEGIPLKEFIGTMRTSKRSKYLKQHQSVLSEKKSYLVDEKLDSDHFVTIELHPWKSSTDEATAGGIGFAWDTSDFNLARESLFRSEENYRLLVNSLHDLLIKIDSDYIIKFMNNDFHTLDSSECIGKNFLDLFLDKDPIQKNNVKGQLDLLFRRGTSCSWEWAPNGSAQRHLSTSATPIIKENKVVAATLLTTDVTDKIIAETASIASRAKSQFIANISHDIRNPIHAILSLSHLLASTSNLNDLQFEYVEDIIANSQLLLSIISDVLDMSKIEAGRISIIDNPMSVLDLVESTADMFYNQAAEKKLDIFTQVDCNIPAEVYGDKSRIGQALMNLTINSIKYTNHGHIFITARQIRETAKKTTIRFSCEDTGVGIPKEDLPRLFKPYIQIDNASDATGHKDFSSSIHKGYGLGLSIVDRLIKLMGGTISVESTAGIGSKFTFDLTLRKLKPGLKTDIIKESIGKGAYDYVMIVATNPILRSVIFSYTQVMQIRHIYSIDPTIDRMEKKIADFCDMYSDRKAAIVMEEQLHYSLTNPSIIQCKLVLLQCKYMSEKHVRHPDVVTVVRKPLTLLRYASAMCIGRRKASDPLTSYKERIADLKAEYESKDISILVVDDSPVNRKVLERFLVNIGISKIDTANNGQEGLDHVVNGKVPYDCIFLDLRMPVMDGIECAKRIRSLDDQRKSHIPIIAVTANAWQTSISEALEIGCNEVLTKPVSMENVIEKLHKFIT